MQRFGWIIGIKPEAIDTYRHHHDHSWPEVQAMIRECNIRNYTIFLKDNLLFGYYEYHGGDHEADMAKMARDAKTLEWWSIMGPCQQPLETRQPGEWWARMEEIWHQD